MTKIQIQTEKGMKTAVAGGQKKLVNIFNWGNAVKFLFTLIIICSVYYITGVNDLTTKGFRLKELKQKTKDLAGANKEFELEIMSLKSYNNLSERVGRLSMVSAADAKYISDKVEAVAKK